MDASQQLAPGLQSVKYKTILPMGKVGEYKQNERLEFVIPSDIAYFDGKQSYLNVVMRNLSVDEGDAPFPSCFPPHVGAHAIVNRLQIQDMKGAELENLEAYNQYQGIMNSYCNDTDVYGTLSRVEGIAAHNPREENCMFDDVKVNYFTDVGASNVSSNLVIGGGDAKTCTFCLPIMSGLYSYWAGEHMAYPNLDIGGTKMTFYLEEYKNSLQALSHHFVHDVNLNGNGVSTNNAVKIGTDVAGTGASTTEFDVSLTVCMTNVQPDGVEYEANQSGFVVGQTIQTGGATGTADAVITKVEVGQGAGMDQLRITYAPARGNNDATSIKVLQKTSGFEWIIDKVELKVLETIPDSGTLRAVRSAMSRGINYTTYQLNKLSTASQLKNAVLNIPTSLTRGLSIFCVPVDIAKIGLDGAENSYLYPRMDSSYAGNDNNYNYIWQVRNILIPNRQLELTTTVNAPSDNVTFYNQQAMALRPMRPVKCLGEPFYRTNRDKQEHENPFFFPILLAPLGNSYDLLDSDPQLRIENTSSTPGNITSKLYFIYQNHVRRLIANDSGVQVDL